MSVKDVVPVWKFVLLSLIAAGIQFGWALQLSLLTPYVQMLGLPHGAASFIWLCGPISGLLVQPIAGYFSDRCNCRFGRRRPFIAAGASLVGLAVVLIGFAADIGYSAGDDLTEKTKPRAVAIFVVGFWILDVANNMLQVSQELIERCGINPFMKKSQTGSLNSMAGSMQGIPG